MKILAINGSPRSGGFSEKSLEIIVSYIKDKDIEMEMIKLSEKDIRDCIGCFKCLNTGKCVIDDDMEDIINKMFEAQGYVISSSVRNGLVTACYKRFYERITYVLGFPRLLEDKYTLAISSVGSMGGKAINKKFLGLQDICYTKLSDYVFYRTGMPPNIQFDQIKKRLEKGAERLIYDIENKRGKKLSAKLSAYLDRIIMNRFIFSKSPEHFANVIACWKKKNYIKN